MTATPHMNILNGLILATVLSKEFICMSSLWVHHIVVHLASSALGEAQRQDSQTQPKSFSPISALPSDPTLFSAMTLNTNGSLTKVKKTLPSRKLTKSTILAK